MLQPGDVFVTLAGSSLPREVCRTLLGSGPKPWAAGLASMLQLSESPSGEAHARQEGHKE